MRMLPHGYRLCVFASGSLITDIFICWILISVSCLHFGQNRGKCSSIVSSRILRRVLLLQTGQYIHSARFIFIYHRPLCFAFFFSCRKINCRSASASFCSLLRVFRSILFCSCWSFSACCALVPIPLSCN